NPEDTIVVDGRTLTRLALRYYGRYAYVGRHLDWNQVQVVAELGSGAGGQTEVLAKLHPELTLLLFDIPPQLYICEQYLKAVFGDRVISYRQARTLLPDSKPTKGKIHVLGNWMLDRVVQSHVDLFWSACTLCSTEPETVATYLSIVDQAQVPGVYLAERFDG